MQDFYGPVRERRQKGRRWTTILLFYILVTTIPLLLFRYELFLLCFFNPFMFIHFTFEYLSYTMATAALFPGAVIGILVLTLLPLAGWLLLRLRFWPGVYLIRFSEILAIFINAVVLIYMTYTSSAINVMLTFTTYLLLAIPAILFPALVLYALKCWNPRACIRDEAKLGWK